jgi:hypothetical protein
METVFEWSRRRRVHVVTAGALTPRQQDQVRTALSGIADSDVLAEALAIIFERSVRHREFAPDAADHWYEVGFLP